MNESAFSHRSVGGFMKAFALFAFVILRKRYQKSGRLTKGQRKSTLEAQFAPLLKQIAKPVGRGYNEKDFTCICDVVAGGGFCDGRYTYSCYE